MVRSRLKSYCACGFPVSGTLRPCRARLRLHTQTASQAGSMLPETPATPICTRPFLNQNSARSLHFSDGFLGNVYAEVEPTFPSDMIKGLSNNKLSILSGRGWRAAALPIACSERHCGALDWRLLCPSGMHRIQPRPPKWTIYYSRVPNSRQLCLPDNVRFAALSCGKANRKRQTRRKAGTQSFRSNGFIPMTAGPPKAHSSGKDIFSFLPVRLPAPCSSFP
jgi:hypothetical protein